MIVVSNSSPLIGLAAVGQLTVLQYLYGTVVIPTAVYHEVVVQGAGAPGAAEVPASPWIQTQSVSAPWHAKLLQENVDAGEAEAIALALELHADLLLIDDREGKQAAARHGLQCVGVLGILLAAKNKGLIAAVKPIVDELIAKTGFRITPQLYAHVLQTAEE